MSPARRPAKGWVAALALGAPGRARAVAARAGIAAAIAIGALGAAAAEARATDAPATSREARARAAARFKEGEAAFRRHAYAEAAKAFEEAYEIAPHPAAFVNAAEAWHRAGNLARAANLCAQFLRESRPDDATRAEASARLAELRPKLGRLAVQTRGGESPKVDGAPVDPGEVFVDPGDHVVSAEYGGQKVVRKVSVVAGSLVQVILQKGDGKTPQGEESGEGAGPAEGARPRPAAEAGGLPPIVFFAGVGATAILGGVAIWSGIDTRKAREEYDASPTHDAFQEGVAKQTRTNALAGATAVVGVATAAIGLFATDWTGGDDAAPRRPAGAGATGRGSAAIVIGPWIGPGLGGVAGRFR